MLNSLLNLGCTFDWITPTLAFVQDFFRGPIGDFGIPSNCGWDRRDINRYLTAHDVPVWGLIYNLPAEVLMFTVPKDQAELTYFLLNRAGVPVLYAPVDLVDMLPEEGSETIAIYADESAYCYNENL